MNYRQLGDFVELSQGLAVNKGTAHLFSDVKTPEYPYPLLRIVDFGNDEHDNYSKYVSKDISKSMIIDDNNIVFTRVTGECFRGFSGVLHNNLFTVKLISDEITEDYLFTVLQSDFINKQAFKAMSSSVVPDLSHEKFKSMIIPVPDKNTQKKISDVYLSLCEKIANNNSVISELEAMAKEIYDYWFVQFDFPDENGKPYKSSGGKMVMNEELGREIPEGWINTTVAEACTFENGDRGKNYPSGSDFVKEGIPFINGGMIDGSQISNELQYITNEKYDSLRAGRVNKGDILITLRGSVDKCAYSPFEKAAIASALVIVRPQNIINNQYLYYYLNSDYYKNICRNYDNGSVQANLSVDVVKSFSIIVPNRTVLNKWQEYASKIDETIMEKRAENTELTSLRDYLLPLLMNGQVTFSDQEGA